MYDDKNKKKRWSAVLPGLQNVQQLKGFMATTKFR